MIKRIWLIIISIFVISGFIFSLSLEEAHYNLAKKLFDERNFARSAEEFRLFTEKYPYSGNLHSGYYLAAKSYFLAGNYSNAISFYHKLAVKPANLSEKKQALFGESEARFKMADYRGAAGSFENFGLAFPASPAAHAAFYYAARSREALQEWPEAELLYTVLTENYPESPYISDASIRLQNCAAKAAVPVQTNFSSSSAASSAEPLILTSSASSLVLTNVIWISNEVVLTQQNLPETNFEASSSDLEIRKKEEEMDRYRALLELKAKLLKIKERIVRDKNDLILSDTLTNR